MEEASVDKATIYIHKVTIAEVCYNAQRVNADEKM